MKTILTFKNKTKNIYSHFNIAVESFKTPSLDVIVFDPRNNLIRS